MKLKDRFKDLKRDYKDFIVLIVSGSFYVSYDSDAVLLSYLFSYQIKNDRVGFPSSAISRILESLKEKQISFFVDDGDDNNCYDANEENQYFSFYDKAQSNYNNQLMMQVLFDRIKYLIERDSKSYFKIKEFIDAM